MRDDQQTPKGPSLHAFHVKDGKDGISYFNRIGAAFENKDGKGYNLRLPVNGRVTLRTPQDRVAAAKDGTRVDRSTDHGYDR